MKKRRIIIITGNKGEGKTTKLKEVVDNLQYRNYSVIGFLAPAHFIDGKRKAYDFVDITSKESHLLCTADPTPEFQKIGSFYFNYSAIKCGKELLRNIKSENTIIVIDEIGPFEINGLVWDDSLMHLIKTTNNSIIITVRKKLLDEVIRKYNLENYSVINIDDDIQKTIDKFVHRNQL